MLADSASSTMEKLAESKPSHPFTLRPMAASRAKRRTAAGGDDQALGWTESGSSASSSGSVRCRPV